MAGAAKKKENRYSYADYLNWGDERRCELIDGDICAMNAPLVSHQRILREIFGQMFNFFHDKPCELFMSPCDLVLAKNTKKNDEIFTVLQPDIMVVCDEKKIEEQRIVGAPDLIVEIVSPSTAARDNITKKVLYEKAGVREFWLVSPTDRITRVYRLEKDGLYGRESIYDDQAQIDIALFAGLSIDCRRVFPRQPEIKRVKEPPMQYL
ncbi:MAG: Uma2 family endonuclease [Candidatus Rifleibacteriota bacterium]